MSSRSNCMGINPARKASTSTAVISCGGSFTFASLVTAGIWGEGGGAVTCGFCAQTQAQQIRQAVARRSMRAIIGQLSLWNVGKSKRRISRKESGHRGIGSLGNRVIYTQNLTADCADSMDNR